MAYPELRQGSTRWTAVWQACGGVLFCAGAVILPAILAADLTVRLASRNLSRSACLERLTFSINQAALPEGGVLGAPVVNFASIPASLRNAPSE